MALHAKRCSWRKLSLAKAQESEMGQPAHKQGCKRLTRGLLVTVELSKRRGCQNLASRSIDEGCRKVGLESEGKGKREHGEKDEGREKIK